MKTIIIETLGMMGFTFLIGMGVALVIRITVWAFFAFTKKGILNAIEVCEIKIAEHRLFQKKIENELSKIDESIDIPRLKHLYDNKNKNTAAENIDDFYALYNYYRGVSKDNDDKDDDGTIDLIKYYYGEI